MSFTYDNISQIHSKTFETLSSEIIHNLGLMLGSISLFP